MIINGDCLEEMRKMEDNSISAIVTDPPYGLGFMGKEWDAGLPHQEIWKEALRVIKPGGHLLAFGGTRTYHRLTCAIEDAGWEIRDCLMWIYGSGFPKSHNHFGIEGYGTALKPAYEPIIMAMKPCEGTFKQNAEKWGQAGINIDECRITTDECLGRPNLKPSTFVNKINETYIDNTKGLGRWPANILFDEEAAEILDEQSGELKSGSINKILKQKTNDVYGKYAHTNINEFQANSGSASRFFYCAKASSKERNEGLEIMSLRDAGIKNSSGRGFSQNNPHKCIQYKNNHPTVKPIKLMQYLIKLVIPPKDGVLLDPFAGSGSTILAAYKLGVKAIGVEKSAEYCEIAKTRLENYKPEEQLPDLFENIEKNLSAM